MIVYRTLQALETDLGFSPRTLYSAANTIDRHYHEVRIPKRDGAERILHVPDEFLKRIQRRINDVLLAGMPVSRYATAYNPGNSIMQNAQPHAGKHFLLKLDIRDFFDHITYPLVKEKVFPEHIYSEQNRILLSVLCVYHDSIPQGAPTSDLISNIVLYDFDRTVGRYCRERNIAFTRYCDDMSFSGDFDPQELTAFVSEELRKDGFYLNRKKTVTARPGQAMRVTGLSVNETVNVPSEYRRKIRQEMHFIQKYGTAEHIKRLGIGMEEQAYLNSLKGRIAYVLSVHEIPEFREYLKQISLLEKRQMIQ